MDRPTSVASYTASIGTGLGGLLSLNNIALVLGILFTAITFLINWRYQSKRHDLEVQKRKEDAEYHKARMREILKQDHLDFVDKQLSANDPLETQDNG